MTAAGLEARSRCGIIDQKVVKSYNHPLLIVPFFDPYQRGSCTNLTQVIKLNSSFQKGFFQDVVGSHARNASVFGWELYFTMGMFDGLRTAFGYDLFCVTTKLSLIGNFLQCSTANRKQERLSFILAVCCPRNVNKHFAIFDKSSSSYLFLKSMKDKWAYHKLISHKGSSK